MPVGEDDVLLVLARGVLGVATRAAGRLGRVSVTQLRALTVLRGQDGAGLAALAAALGITVSTASRLVDRLVDAGLAERHPSPRTRREIVLTPSPAGRALLDRYDALRLTELRAALDAVPGERRGDVLAALAAFGTALPTGPPPVERAAPVAGPDGGDPACWLHRVCPACGRMADGDPPTTCPACGEPLPVP
ncbi:MarR family transcriptional regulator [Geodermatophilus sabuli]|uniref:MarR family transcriptional regulator n=1 Tax=Geodermatophilus sabuli TaxID=1564158 RepID=A0A7K3W1Z5_9ACTN|nr:MarR family transcriptional regulator [Geodermatophilus sabuli]